MERILCVCSARVRKSISLRPWKTKEGPKINHGRHDTSKMNGVVFQKDCSPYMEHLTLSSRHQECLHHLNSAGILPSASWAWFMFLFCLCSSETLKVHEGARTTRGLFICRRRKQVRRPATLNWLFRGNCKNDSLVFIISKLGKLNDLRLWVKNIFPAA